MKIDRLCALLLALAFAFIMTGCHPVKPVVKKTEPTAPTPTAPSATLKVTPDTVQKGQSAELAWTTQNASTVTIDGIGTVSASGSQKITPPGSTTYHLTAKGDGGSTEASARITVNTPTETTTSRLTDEQLFEQNMKDIFFNYDNFDIRSDETQTASADAAFLAQHPNIKFIIEGHCDERGSEVYNMGLGENRASAVKQALVQQGVSADRIKIISYGKEKPFCTTEEDETCWQQNRRAHFHISD